VSAYCVSLAVQYCASFLYKFPDCVSSALLQSYRQTDKNKTFKSSAEVWTAWVHPVRQMCFCSIGRLQGCAPTFRNFCLKVNKLIMYNLQLFTLLKLWQYNTELNCPVVIIMSVRPWSHIRSTLVLQYDVHQSHQVHIRCLLCLCVGLCSHVFKSDV